MIEMTARVLVRMGVAMLILSLLVRRTIDTNEAMMGDNLALIACLAVVATGLIGGRIGRRIDEPLAQLRSKQSERNSFGAKERRQ